MRPGPLAALLVVAACSGDGRATETLEPLPVEGGTAATAAPTEPPAPTDGSTPRARPTTSSTVPTTTATAPFGDWDGARFDVGVIETVSSVGGYTAIGFDRYSLVDAERGTIDAEAFDEEPLVAWWRENPYVNVNPQLRTFVLDPAVEVLVLDEADRATACVEPPPPSPPRPVWDDADVDLLEDPTTAGRIAVLTYSPTGQVTRIRLTAGC